MSTISLTGGGENALLNTDGEINQTVNTFSPPGVVCGPSLCPGLSQILQIFELNYPNWNPFDDNILGITLFIVLGCIKAFDFMRIYSNVSKLEFIKDKGTQQGYFEVLETLLKWDIVVQLYKGIVV